MPRFQIFVTGAGSILILHFHSFVEIVIGDEESLVQVSHGHAFVHALLPSQSAGGE